MSAHPFKAVIFDLDGVITKTASVHSHAWKKMFDDYLRYREEEYGEPFREFLTEDYLHYVDGKPRYDGVKSFLGSRNISLPFGTPEDVPELETVCGLGNRKNIAFNEVLKAEGVEAYPSTVKLIEQLKKDNVRIGVASSSKNAENVLEAAGLSKYIETRVDGVVSAKLGLSGKPEPDIFTTAAKNLGVEPNDAVVVEDAVSGVRAGKKGNFGLVIGLAREDNTEALKANGADIVVRDFDELPIDEIDAWFEKGIETDGWTLTYHDYDPGKEKSREALLTVGNGYFGTRGAMEESTAGKSNYPGTYVAGLYNRLVTRIADRDIENEDFVNIPNWLKISFKVEDGNWFNPNDAIIEKISRTLDFRNGLLSRILVVCDEEGKRTKIESFRLASMNSMHLAAIKYRVTPLNYSGAISFCSTLEGTHINAGVERYNSLNQQHLAPVNEGGDHNISYLEMRTTGSDIRIVEASRLEVGLQNGKPSNGYGMMTEEGMAYTLVDLDAVQGQPIELEKIVSIHTSIQSEKEDLVAKCIDEVKKALTFDALLQESATAWQDIWEKADIKIKGDRLSQKLLRLHIYHLMVSASPNNVNLDASVTARGLHGEAYRGHIFWDELFILPFFIIHFPDVARSLLLYRYNRLDKAREYARQSGYKGAMFPWQSGSDGREETQVVHLNPLTGEWGDDHSSLQRHVSLAIAYDIWLYYHISSDKKFLESYGAEMFLEICRFWASKAEFDELTGRYSIDEVMGPDEFHEMYSGSEKGGLKDNAYTNIMVAWVFGQVPVLLSEMSEDTKASLFRKIGFEEKESDEWKKISENLRLVISNDGIISQYDGYFDLKELDWNYYREKYGNIYRMDRLLKAEGKSADDYMVAKQADTLMTFYNLDKQQLDDIFQNLKFNLPEDYLRRNLDYYLQRTSHGSTLSRVVHAQLALLAGDKNLSWQLFSDALSSDFDDIQGGTTAEGIHAGVMAGTLMIALSAYAGVDLRKELLTVNPALPDGWKKITFKLTYKGVGYSFDITKDTISVIASEDAVFVMNNEKVKLQGEKITRVAY